MLAEAAAEFASVKAAFAEASDALGYDLWALVSDGPEDQLSLTEFTQPAILTASVALYRALSERHAIAPMAGAGHSLGEYSALVAAGALSLGDGASLVSKRGAAMQRRARWRRCNGGCPRPRRSHCADICSDISTAEAFVGGVNFNAPARWLLQVQLALSRQRSLRLKTQALACNATACERTVPYALMQPAADVMAEAFETVSWHDPSFPVVSNVDGSLQASPDR